jgi:hypothetical protein
MLASMPDSELGAILIAAAIIHANRHRRRDLRGNLKGVGLSGQIPMLQYERSPGLVKLTFLEPG